MCVEVECVFRSGWEWTCGVFRDDIHIRNSAYWGTVGIESHRSKAEASSLHHMPCNMLQGSVDYRGVEPQLKCLFCLESSYQLKCLFCLESSYQCWIQFQGGLNALDVQNSTAFERSKVVKGNSSLCVGVCMYVCMYVYLCMVLLKNNTVFEGWFVSVLG